MKTYSLASSALEKVRGQMNKDRRFKKRADKIAQMLVKYHCEI